MRLNKYSNKKEWVYCNLIALSYIAEQTRRAKLDREKEKRDIAKQLELHDFVNFTDALLLESSDNVIPFTKKVG